MGGDMKRVSFKVAKAVEQAGYKQDVNDENEDEIYVVFSDEPDNPITYQSAKIQGYLRQSYLNKRGIEYCFCPTYLEVWLWLWREKKIHIDVDSDCNGDGALSFDYKTREAHEANDPEAAIEKAIKYLVENNLIK